MENEIAITTMSYLVTRLALLAALGYAFYRVLRPAYARVDNRPAGAIRRASSVPDDRC